MTQSLHAALEDFRPELPLLVAYSGGADSTALLHGCAAKWPGQVRAAHVHHGLQAAADEFAEHCVRTCLALDVPLGVARVDANHRQGQSPEDAARRARYAALYRIALEQEQDGRVCDIALAQQADDQAETLLLALSRGAGLPGLSAMPSRWQVQSGAATITLHRPFLKVSAAEIRAWLLQQGLDWIEDPSNRDEGLTRNCIRARIMPGLASAFPSFLDTFARSSAHAAQAQELLNEIAASDLTLVGGRPNIQELQKLSRARQTNLLRHWLKSEHQTSATAAQLDELLQQIEACRSKAHSIHIRVGQGFARRDGDHLAWQTDTP